MTRTDDTPGLLARVVAGLQYAGRLVTTDWEAETFEVSPPEPEPGRPAADPVVGVLLTHARRVAFYAVWPDPVPAETLSSMGELAHRINTELYTSAVELNLDSGVLAVRSGFEFDGVPDLTRDQENALAYNALLETEAVFDEYRDAIAAVIGGGTPLDALAAE